MPPGAFSVDRIEADDMMRPSDGRFFLFAV